MTSVQYAIASDSTPLHWQEYIIKDGQPHPAAICIPGGGFHSLLSIPVSVPNALNAAGYNAFTQTQYRIAPPNKIPGQVADGRFPCQTNDCELAVAEAKADPRCNGEVVIVGGSAGAYEALWLAAKGLVKAVVCLSPATQLDDPSSLQQSTFNHDVNNYAPGHLAEASPNNLLTSESSPVFIVAFVQDNMPPMQFTLAVDKFESLGVPYDSMLLQGSGHSWDCWRVNGVPDAAIAFLSSF